MERLYQTFKQTDFVLLAVSMDRQGKELPDLCGQLETYVPSFARQYLR
jgi:hypothetical protein